jgi:putative Holliday junction resolvase
MSRLVALDHGSARCGVAVTDPSRTIVSPWDPVLRPDTETGFAKLVEMIRSSEAEGVVIGLPLGLDGEATPQTNVARSFAGRLASAVAPVWVELLDERLTTSEARLRGGSTSEDSRAAAILLERWMETNPS